MKLGVSATLLVLALLATACAPAAPRASQAEQPAAVKPPRPLSIVIRVEPIAILEGRGGVSQNHMGRALFAATVSRISPQEVPYPILAEVLPELSSDTWRVLPDGKMETVHRLRPALTWHDGTPLAAEDFVLGHRSRTARIAWGLQQSSLEARAVEEVRAEDSLTVVVRWRHPYADAATMELDPLPRHVLAGPLERGPADVYGSLPFWTTEYVGAGPYRLQRWEVGALIEGTAFEAYALGRPKIERIMITWSTDPNASLTRLLAGDVDMAADSALQFQQAVVLRPTWAEGNRAPSC